MSQEYFVLIYFFYGLAFFSMGLAIVLERGHATDARLRHALLPLAMFGLLHGGHEWLEMFELAGQLPGQENYAIFWEAFRLAILAFSFLSLAAFGAYLIARTTEAQRLSLLLPLGLATVWAFGVFIMRGIYPASEMWAVADVWTRYVLAVPAAIVASIGLIVQQHEFRKAGLAQFGRDCLWAAVAFFWYGLFGQTFPRASMLPPSDVINAGLFYSTFGFPIQMVRATAAIVAAIFVMRFLRAFEVENKQRIASLNEARLQEAQRREVLRGELLRRVVAAQEAERQRIARELHDETGQALTAIGLGLRGVSSLLHSDDERSVKNLRHLESLADYSLRELQRLIADLRPSHLDDLGLPAALRWYAGEVEKRASLVVIVDVDGEARSLTSELNTTLFRIGQEALTNIVKHASASRATVHLSYLDGGVRMVIQDDGVGFRPAEMATGTRSPYGLIGMRERAALLGGDFNLSSSPGSGTTVEVMIPYSELEQSSPQSDLPNLEQPEETMGEAYAPVTGR